MDTILYYCKKLIPVGLFKAIQPPYHYVLALIGALIYRFPSKEITVIGVTGTKGKSTVVFAFIYLHQAISINHM